MTCAVFSGEIHHRLRISGSGLCLQTDKGSPCAPHFTRCRRTHCAPCHSLKCLAFTRHHSNLVLDLIKTHFQIPNLNNQTVYFKSIVDTASTAYFFKKRIKSKIVSNYLGVLWKLAPDLTSSWVTTQYSLRMGWQSYHPQQTNLGIWSITDGSFPHRNI